MGGSYINLGWHKNNNQSPEKRNYNETFLSHTAQNLGFEGAYSKRNSSSIPGLHSLSSSSGAVGSDGLARSSDGRFDPCGGLRDTKFGTGFSRKSESIIENAAADEMRAKMGEKNIIKGACVCPPASCPLSPVPVFSQTLTRAAQQPNAHTPLYPIHISLCPIPDRLNESRAQFLKSNDEKSGFNVISHAPRGHGVQPIKQGKKRIEMVVSAEIAANSRIQLRESEGRFFMPHASGVGHEYRQKVLGRDGVNGDRYSSVLQEGKADLKSYGIEDNFGKSRYPGGPAVPPDERVGLHEMREAGKFTPRKQPMHPSGNDEIVRNWGSGLDLSCAALRGKLK